MPRRLLLTLLAGALPVLGVSADAAAAWTWPVVGQVVTPYRNGGDPYAAGQHRGIDVAAPVGTRVVAAAGGTVRFAGVAGSSGLTVSIRTTDARWDMSYLHLATATVHEGDRVVAGARVGTVGTSGRRSVSQPHLHFGVREAGSRHAYRDPLDFLPALPRAPAPDPPRGAPVAVRSPVRTAPSPVPVGRPAPVRVPARTRVRRPARAPQPAGRRIRVPARGGVRVPIGSPVPARAPRPVEGHSAGDPGRVRHPAGSAVGVPEPQMGPHPVETPAARPHDAAARPGAATAAAKGGPDFGWAVACLGLLAAAACIGLGKGGGEAGAGSRSRAAALLGAPGRPACGQ